MLKKSQNEELSLREYNSLLFYIARVSGDFNSASKYFDEMKAKNMRFEYSTLYELINYSTRAGETVFMQKCLDEMILNKFELRMHIYKAMIMITAYLNKKEIDMAFKILDMVFDQISNSSLATKIMSMFCKYFNGLNDVSALENLYQRFDAVGKLRFNEKVFVSMCVAHAKAGNLDMMEKYIQYLKNSGAVQFNSGKYVLEAYAKHGTKEDLENSYRRLEQDFGFRNVFYYNKLMAKFK